MKTRLVFVVGLGAALLLMWKLILAALVGGAIVGGVMYATKPAQERAATRQEIEHTDCEFDRLLGYRSADSRCPRESQGGEE